METGLTRMFHELLAATEDMAVLLSELYALRAGSRASSGVALCDVPFRYASTSILDFGSLISDF
jgi:hypothetical protein